MKDTIIIITFFPCNIKKSYIFIALKIKSCFNEKPPFKEYSLNNLQPTNDTFLFCMFLCQSFKQDIPKLAKMHQIDRMNLGIRLHVHVCDRFIMSTGHNKTSRGELYA